MTDAATYWATIAQVVPVVFIGVMIEFRWLLARVAASEDKFISSVRVRFLISLWLAAVCASLAFSFYFALVGLRRNLSSDNLMADVALGSLGAGAAFSMLGPGILLAYSTAPDMWKVMWRSLPWSSVAKARRMNDELDLLIKSYMRSERNKLLEARMSLAAAYVDLSRMDLKWQRLPGGPPAKVAARIEQEQRDLDALRVEIDEFARDPLTSRAYDSIKLISLTELEGYRVKLAELAARKA